MVTLISGAARTDLINDDQKVRDMLKDTQFLDPDKYPLVSGLEELSRNLEKTRMKSEWRERALRQNYVTITAADTAAAGTLTVSAGEGDILNVMPDFILWRPATDEIMQVASESAGTVTVLSAAGAGTTAPLTATVIGEKIIMLTESHAEGEAAPSAFSQQSVTHYNYMMQIARTVQSTDIQLAEEDYGSNQYDDDLRIAWIETMRGYDLAMWFGQRTRDTTSATARRHIVGGVMERIVTNVTDFSTIGGGFTYLAFCEHVRPTTEHASSSGKKRFFAGTNAMMSMAAWSEGKLETRTGENKYGMNIRQVETPYGTVEIQRNIQFSGANSAADRAALLDMDHIWRTHLRTVNKSGRAFGGDLRMIEDYDTTSPTAIKSIILGCCGIEMHHEELHAEALGIR